MVFKKTVTLCLVGFTATIGSAEEAQDSRPQPKERPRLGDNFQKHQLSPYQHRYRLHRYFYDPYFTYPASYWGMSSLRFDALYGFLPAPGRTQLSVSLGSDDYFGTSISHTNYLSKKHNILYNVTALWETGETWWSGQDFESFTIAPSLFWSNENTSVYLGFEHTETRLDPITYYRSMDRRLREANQADSPSASSSKWEIDRMNVGIDRKVNDFFTIGLHLNVSDFSRKRD